MVRDFLARIYYYKIPKE